MVEEWREGVAVLTGDIVGSSRLRGKDPGAGDLLDHAAAGVKAAFPEAGWSGFSVFRGDSWQVCLGNARCALSVALYLRVWLRASDPDLTPPLDTRVAIAIGRVDKMPGGSVLRGEGPAFELSGALLDALSDPVALAMGGLPFASEWVSASIGLMDYVISQWTPLQARAVLGALEGKKQEAIGELWSPPISQQSVAMHLRRAGWTRIEATLQAFSDLLQAQGKHLIKTVTR